MNENNPSEEIIYCPRCKSEMKNTQRYCMKCGNLNYNHPLNKNMQVYNTENNQEKYEIGDGNDLKINTNQLRQTIANNTGNPLICFIVNLLLFMIMPLKIIISLGTTTIDGNIMIKYFPIYLIINSVLFIFVYSLQLLYMKANKRWWSVFIPVYNLITLTDIVFNKKVLTILLFIPIIGQITYLILLYKLGKKYKTNPILTMIIPFIMIPIIGFGNNYYENKTNIINSNSQEKEYKLKKIYLILTILPIIASILILSIYNREMIKNIGRKIHSIHYVYASKKIVYEVKSRIDKDAITCNQQYNKENGTYIFYLPDAAKKTFILFDKMKEPIKTTIKVINEDGKTNYILSISDGEYGFENLNIEEVNLDSIIKYDGKDININTANCEFNY